MKYLIPLLLFFISFYTYSAKGFLLSKNELFTNIKPRLKSGAYLKKFRKDESYFHYGYKTTLPRVNRAKEWLSDEIMFFSNKGKSFVSQVALVSYRCGIDTSPSNQNLVLTQARKLFAREGKLLFDKEIIIDDNEIKPLGPYQRKIKRVTLEKTILGIKKVRLSRGMYKCDGLRGYGYRLDLFFGE